MLNALQLNTAELNSLVPLPTGAYYLGYPFIQFDGNSLQNDEIISSEIKGWSAPNRDLVSFATPRSDGGGLLSAFFRERRVRVSGILKQATAADLDDAMDDLKRKMKKREGNLDLKFNGVVRRVRATLANPEEMFEDRQSYHLTTCPFRLEFLALEPFWHALVYSSNDPTTYTGLAENPTIEYDGTADAELVTVIIVNAATAITALHLENSTTGEIIEVTTAISAGDIIEIDGENKTVKKNGTALDYDGVFPTLAYGVNELDVTFTGTSISYNPTFKYRKTFI